MTSLDYDLLSLSLDGVATTYTFDTLMYVDPTHECAGHAQMALDTSSSPSSGSGLSPLDRYLEEAKAEGGVVCFGNQDAA
jgi:hypothetical protein